MQWRVNHSRLELLNYFRGDLCVLTKRRSPVNHSVPGGIEFLETLIFQSLECALERCCMITKLNGLLSFIRTCRAFEPKSGMPLPSDFFRFSLTDECRLLSTGFVQAELQ